MYKFNLTKFYVSSNWFEATEEDPIVLGDFQDSFNTIVGTKADIDWFNNPYISANVVELDENWDHKISDEIKLRKCEKKDFLKFMTESSLTYYPNSLCFEDPDKIKLHGNWFDSKYKNIEIILTACDQ